MKKPNVLGGFRLKWPKTPESARAGLLSQDKVASLTSRLDFPHLSECIERLQASPPRLVLVSAPAGFGKSSFVQMFRRSCGDEWIVFDQLPDAIPLDASRPVLLACRPEEVPAELDRMRLYGEVAEIGPNELGFPKSSLSQAVWERTAGWPLLLREGAWSLDNQVFVRFLAQEVLSDLPFEVLFKAVETHPLPEPLLQRVPPLRTPGTKAGKRFSQLIYDAVLAAVLRRYELQGLSRLDREMLWRQSAFLTQLLKTAVAQQHYELAVRLFEELGGGIFSTRLARDRLLILFAGFRTKSRRSPMRWYWLTV